MHDSVDCYQLISNASSVMQLSLIYRPRKTSLFVALRLPLLPEAKCFVTYQISSKRQKNSEQKRRLCIFPQYADLKQKCILTQARPTSGFIVDRSTKILLPSELTEHCPSARDMKMSNHKAEKKSNFDAWYITKYFLFEVQYFS